MCVIICCDKKSGHVKSEMLEAAENMNQDGMGIAWINKNNEVQWVKGLDSKQVLEVIKKQKISLPYIVHARIASIGSVRPELTHPFEISQDANMNLKGTTRKGVLFHNGTWTDYQDDIRKTLIKKSLRMYKGENSDSRSMAFLANHYGIEYLNLLTDQKIAVLTPKGIIKFGDFPKVDKHECSNNYFKYGNGFSNRFSFCGIPYGDDFSDYGMETYYCWKCDRDLDERHFTYDFELCNDCFMEKKDNEMNDILDQNMINAKAYDSSKHHEIVKKYHTQNKEAIP